MLNNDISSEIKSFKHFIMNTQYYHRASETSPTRQVSFQQRQIDVCWTLVTETEQPSTTDDTFERLFVNDPNEW